MRAVFRAALALAALTGTAVAGPDFVAGDRRQPLAASDGTSNLEPMDDVVFEYDSAALLPAAQAQIARAAKWLARHPDHRLVVEGRADSSGPFPYNQDLAGHRAVMVRNHLIGCGVAPDRIVLAVYGENAARPRPDPLDRRVVMFASRAPLHQVVSAELDRNAIEMLWTRNGTRFRETRGITPVAALEPAKRR
jgi:outer membrane protein OmpA-like peptidoglycan-associated protein